MNATAMKAAVKATVDKCRWLLAQYGIQSVYPSVALGPALYFQFPLTRQELRYARRNNDFRRY